MSATTKIVLLDRDGVINHDSPHYIKSIDEFIPIPENIAAVARLTAAGYRIGIATNQSGIARGLYSEEDLIKIHRKMIEVIEAAGGRIDAIEYCSHLPNTDCLCRKPKPGMLLALAKKLGCSSLQGIPFVGDRVSDIQAAEAAGASPVIVLSAMTDGRELLNYLYVPTFNSLAQWVDSLMAKQCLVN
ncbi:D,D-heptose 1,7-bisphosphate phosphatase [Legionella beliardensis]|uniref:D,D-heptose 1,7-bisphosphate phosphatase n=1 Tax=Legionella beliardensis TaxID=91822 RepID=A0A378I355_9GAMM|nr:D-glycero-beta-D-manno-heptose 1,7-bisphosphate 7-phosphatase [Legionella beliardensis]STX29598.1 D,D-heptose 1,7-bisphosphate phosphatase [Legionella beliardensis]